VKGMSLAAEAGVEPGQAIEIGFGDGTESLALLAAGWQVLAVDPTPQAAEYLAGLQRERAEFTNFRRRTADERERDAGLAADGLLRKVLALADDFDRAIDARPEALADDPWTDGVTAIDRKLRLLLESEGVSAIEVVPGVPFDPYQHEALVNVPGTDLPEGAIVSELQRGYRIRDRILRPAMVAVAAAPSDDVDPIN